MTCIIGDSIILSSAILIRKAIFFDKVNDVLASVKVGVTDILQPLPYLNPTLSSIFYKDKHINIPILVYYRCPGYVIRPQWVV